MSKIGFNSKLGDWLIQCMGIMQVNEDFTENLVQITNKINMGDDLEKEELQIINKILCAQTMLTLMMERYENEFVKVADTLRQ